MMLRASGKQQKKAERDGRVRITLNVKIVGDSDSRKFRIEPLVLLYSTTVEYSVRVRVLEYFGTVDSNHTTQPAAKASLTTQRVVILRESTAVCSAITPERSQKDSQLGRLSSFVGRIRIHLSLRTLRRDGSIPDRTGGRVRNCRELSKRAENASKNDHVIASRASASFW
jgi:hypothetical protein